MATMRDWEEPARTESANALTISTVLVPLDGSEASKAALPVARLLAQIQGASLHVVSVGVGGPGPRESLEQVGLRGEEARGIILDQVSGAPLEGILQLSRDLPDSIVVMCSQIGEDPRGETLGELAKGLLTAVPDRILFVPFEEVEVQWRINLVLMPHDGTPSADMAIAPTAQLAHRAGAEVIALHVAARGSSGPEEPGSLPAPRYIDQPQHEWPAWASEFVNRMLAIGGSAAAINFKLLVTGGQPGSEIAQFARENHVDLVVLPWHGHWEEQRTGAVDVIVRRSGCPVLLLCTPSQS